MFKDQTWTCATAPTQDESHRSFVFIGLQAFALSTSWSILFLSHKTLNCIQSQTQSAASAFQAGMNYQNDDSSHNVSHFQLKLICKINKRYLQQSPRRHGEVFVFFMTHPASPHHNISVDKANRSLQPMLMSIVGQRPLVAILIITTAKEEARWDDLRCDKVAVSRREGWMVD